MEQSTQNNSSIKSALFVDFDNIYIGLSKTDPQAAERFASDPARWLAWLEKGLPLRAEPGGEQPPARQRSILIRRCYPNPDAGFRRFRSFFTSSAFSVIDCPSLTRTGKNSSDIYMVMDILDTLEHKTYFDEFIIFSGDSDFMPVLLRLRAHDRRTTTLAIDFMPPAYKAACDLVISEEEFIEDALGVSHEANCAGNGGARNRVGLPVLKEMAARVYEAICEEGEVAGSSLPEILKDFREFRDSTNWLGFGTSQRLAEALVCCEPRLSLVRVNPLMYKLISKTLDGPGGVQRGEPQPANGNGRDKVSESTPLPAAPSPAAGKAGVANEKAPGQAAEPASERAPGKNEQGQLRTRVVALVKEMVAESRSALLLARVSQYVVSKLGPQVLESQWAGAGSFKRLLQSTTDLGLEITTQPEPGYIYDPRRHTPPASRRGRGAVVERVPSEDEAQAPAGSGPPEEEQVADESMPVEGALTGEPLPAEADEQPSDSERADRAPADDFAPEQPSMEPSDWLPDSYHEEGQDGQSYEEALPSLEEFIRRVSRVTGAPDLSPSQYALVFHGMVHELQQIASEQKVYSTYQSSKAVSDWCDDHGEHISRSDVVLIFKGIIFQDGVRFGKRPGSYTERELAEIVRNNIKALCQRSQLELTEYENHLLDEWILSGLEEMQAGPDEQP